MDDSGVFGAYVGQTCATFCHVHKQAALHHGVYVCQVSWPNSYFLFNHSGTKFLPDSDLYSCHCVLGLVFTCKHDADLCGRGVRIFYIRKWFDTGPDLLQFHGREIKIDPSQTMNFHHGLGKVRVQCQRAPQAVENVERNSICMFSTMCVTFKAICVNESNVQDILMCKG